MIQGGACLAGEDARAWAVGLPVLLIGGSLSIGCLTPVVGFVAEILCASLVFSWLPPCLLEGLGGTPATIFLAVMAAALLLLGPGAYSLDARWFGRREIVIPAPAHRSFDAE